MGIENCDIIKRARELAAQKGLDASMVICGEGCRYADCPFFVKATGPDLSLTSEDRKQERVLEKLEGQVMVERFYGKLEKWSALSQEGTDP